MRKAEARLKLNSKNDAFIENLKGELYWVFGAEVPYIPKEGKKFSNAIFLNFRRNVNEMERFGGRVNVLNKILNSIFDN